MQINQHARLSIAPMMDWTDRHCRMFHRTFTRHVMLYTEMVTSAALVRGGAVQLLEFDPAEHPVALQLGGSDPDELAAAARLGAERGYAEINLNVGCPSDRVQSGTFGAVLMKTPHRVADCVNAMQDAVDVPVTVKCRIGVDDQDPHTVLPEFVDRMQRAGVRRMTVHARKAWLKGLSPKENREVPPLDYDLVRKVKLDFPDMHISLNGGIETLEAATSQLEKGFDGVMIGRAAYHTPWDVLGRADSQVFESADPCSTPFDAVERMMPYIEKHISQGGRLHSVTRHMLGLFHGRPGARQWRRVLSEGASAEDAGPDVVTDALAKLESVRAA